MTNFERITSSVYALEEFLYQVQDDALEAKGCSYDLKMPDETRTMWSIWLKQESDEPVFTWGPVD